MNNYTFKFSSMATTDESALALILFILRVLSLITCTILFIILVRVNNKSDDQPRKSTYILTYLSIISFIISMLISSIQISIYLFISHKIFHSFIVYEICSNIYYLFWNFGQIFYQILFILRLYHGFKETKYQSAIIIYIIFMILIFIFFLCCIMEIIYNTFSYSYSYQNVQNVFSASELHTFGIQ